MIKYFSAFSGIGGFEIAIPENWECVGYSEILKSAIQIYERHFPKHRNFGDITTINATELPDFDCFVGGFPCQSFSIAGKRGGFNDTRGTLFFEIARIIAIKKPKIILLENVKGLLSNDKGKTFETILQTLDELGYDIEWCVFNSTDFGRPQSRPRVYIIGTFRKKSDIGINTGRTKKNGHGKHLTLTKQALEIRDLSGGMMLAKGLSKKHRYCLSARRGLEIRTTTGKKLGECPAELYEIMQGFPLGWTDGIPKTTRKFLLGNALTPDIPKAILKNYASN